MRWIYVIFAFLYVIPLRAQESDPFSADAGKLAGQWVDANGDSILINKVRFGWDVWLAKQGQSSLVPSDGRGGSHVKLAGRTKEDKSFECYYYITFTDNRTMVWSLREGDKEVCPKSGVIKSTLPPEPMYNTTLLGTNVIYYTKRADGNAVTKALADAKVKYTSGMSSKGQENPTIGISCTSDVSVDKIKTLAKILILGGVQLRSIDKITSKGKHNMLEILSLVNDFGVIASPELTVTQINQLQECPNDLSNDFTFTFDVSSLHLYVDSSPSDTARKFCEQEYFASVEDFNEMRHTGNIMYIDEWINKDNKHTYECDNSCQVFRNITCRYK